METRIKFKNVSAAAVADQYSWVNPVTKKEEFSKTLFRVKNRKFFKKLAVKLGCRLGLAQKLAARHNII